MARKPAIEDPKNQYRVMRAVDNYNRRLARAREKVGDLSHVIPENQSYAKMRNELKSLRDINTYINSLNRFDAKSAEIVSYHDDLITKYTKGELQRQVKSLNAYNKRQQETLGEQDIQINDFVSVKVKDYQPDYFVEKDPIENYTKTAEGANKLLETVRARNLRDGYTSIHDQLYYDNYIKSIESSNAGFPLELQDKVKKYLETLGPTGLVKAYYINPDIIDIGYNYDVHSAIVKYQEIMSKFESIYPGSTKKKEYQVKVLEG